MTENTSPKLRHQNYATKITWALAPGRAHDLRVRSRCSPGSNDQHEEFNGEEFSGEDCRALTSPVYRGVGVHSAEYADA